MSNYIGRIKALEKTINDTNIRIRDIQDRIYDILHLYNDTNIRVRDIQDRMYDLLAINKGKNMSAIKDIKQYISKEASIRTAKFIIDNMPATKDFEDKFGLLEYALQNVVVKDGLYLEFGVYSGETINFISSKTNSTVYGFDSFEGLPEDWRTGFGEKTFDCNGILPKVNSNVTLIKGWFDKSLPEFIASNNEQCAFIHIDCDLYSSTKTVFDILKNNICSGTIIVFDEYFNYPDWENGEYKALNEFILECGKAFEYIGYTTDEQVAIKIL